MFEIGKVNQVTVVANGHLHGLILYYKDTMIIHAHRPSSTYFYYLMDVQYENQKYT